MHSKLLPSPGYTLRAFYMNCGPEAMHGSEGGHSQACSQRLSIKSSTLPVFLPSPPRKIPATGPELHQNKVEFLVCESPTQGCPPNIWANCSRSKESLLTVYSVSTTCALAARYAPVHQCINAGGTLGDKP